MSEPCPKCGYQRQPADPGAADECPSCGVFHDKYRQWLERQQLAQQGLLPELVSAAEPPLSARLWAALWQLPERVDHTSFYGRCAVLAGIVAWGLWFIWQPWREGMVGTSFLHGVDLAFHEFGHLLFRPFGEWMMFFGGSLFQCLVPLLLAGHFVFRQGQPFSAAVCLWWFGQNLIDLAPYIGDARALALPLVGEWSEEMAEAREFRHDWHNILLALDALHLDHALAGLAKFCGALAMLLSWAWGGLLLRAQWGRLSGDIFNER
ncbi:MAG TPA: hypothetical protein VLI06_11065 [Solimonas sp.]|nr:hypothetical protein [Solimonas sp.]